MHCPECGEAMVAFEVPDEFAAHLPDQSSAVAACTNCLTVVPAEEVELDRPAFSRISTHIPDDLDAAVPLVLAIGLLDHLALYRSEISTLLTEVERAGSDPILVLERLNADPSLEPSFGLDRRIDQLIQLYE